MALGTVLRGARSTISPALTRKIPTFSDAPLDKCPLSMPKTAEV
jgi:hypothetical protein